MKIRTLSIIMPCFNEEIFVADALQKVILVLLDGNVEKEIIIVNDCSKDNTKGYSKKTKRF